MPVRKKRDLHIRAEWGEMRSWKRAAKRDGETLSEWVRIRLNLGAVEAPAQVPPTVSGDQFELPLGRTR